MSIPKPFVELRFGETGKLNEFLELLLLPDSLVHVEVAQEKFCLLSGFPSSFMAWLLDCKGAIVVFESVLHRYLL